MNHMTRALCVALLSAMPALAEDNPMVETPTWADLRLSVIPEDIDPPVDEARLLLNAPPRAQDPALVPVRMTQPGGDTALLTGAALVVDENPAPVAAEFSFGPAMLPLDLELRVRVNAYSNVRLVASYGDGTRLMSGGFVKASGGCSAAANKDLAEAHKVMGQMRWQAVPEGARMRGKLMIRHPNNSGLQRDQVTLLDIPAHFIDRLDVYQGDDLLWRMMAGISVSEDPVFTFLYTPNGAPIRVHAEDSEGNIWDQVFALDG